MLTSDLFNEACNSFHKKTLFPEAIFANTMISEALLRKMCVEAN